MGNAESTVEPLTAEGLVLARVACGPLRTLREVCRSLAPLAGGGRVRAEAAIADLVASLQVRGGLTTQSPSEGVERLALTPKGVAQLTRLLPMDPAAPPPWSTLTAVDLPAAVAQLPPPTEIQRRRLLSPVGLRAFCLQCHYRFDLEPYPTPAAVKNALKWHLLAEALARGDPVLAAEVRGQRGPFQTQGLGRLLWRRAAGSKGGKITEVQAFNALAAKTLGLAPSASVAELRAGLLRPLFAATGASTGGHGLTPDGSAPELEAFAGAVLRAAQATTTGRLGPHKVLIAPVYRAYCAQLGPGAPSAKAFGDLLLAARQQGLLQLSRLDLLDAMDPDDVRASTLRHDGEVLHLIRLPTP